MSPGSHVLGSWNVGNLSSCFAARPPPDDDVEDPPPHAATVITLKSPTAMPPTLNRLIPNV
jgi:hypothetical protein